MLRKHLKREISGPVTYEIALWRCARSWSDGYAVIIAQNTHTHWGVQTCIRLYIVNDTVKEVHSTPPLQIVFNRLVRHLNPLVQMSRLGPFIPQPTSVRVFVLRKVVLRVVIEPFCVRCIPNQLPITDFRGIDTAIDEISCVHWRIIVAVLQNLLVKRKMRLLNGFTDFWCYAFQIGFHCYPCPSHLYQLHFKVVDSRSKGIVDIDLMHFIFFALEHNFVLFLRLHKRLGMHSVNV